ncbi:MAG: hypothetical protein ACI977_000832 [Candidatus Nanohaloarchaea archaeon]|jgi:uncharacterized protein (TIGR00251 family)
MTEFYVKVEPDSEEQSVNTSSSIINVKLEQPAEMGRANTELINLMQNILGEKPGLISGYQSRRKKLKTSLDENTVKQRLEEYGKDSTEEQ